MDVRFSRFTTGQKYGVALVGCLTLTLMPIAFKRQIPNWLEGIMLMSGTAIALSSWRLASEYGNELEVGNELKQFEKVVRVKQLEVEASARILEYKNLLMPEPVAYDPNIHQMAPETSNSAQSSENETALDFLQFLDAKGLTLKDSNGYFPISKLHQNWGKNRKMNAGQFKEFLAQLTAAELGEFDATQRLWKPLGGQVDG